MRPTIVERPEQPYVAIRNWVRMGELGDALPPQIGEVFGWLAERGLEPAGPPFWKYDVIDMAAELEVEVGVPTVGRAVGDERIESHVLPAGRYVLAHHVGHPDTLEPATGELLAWAEGEGLRFDVSPDEAGERWAARLEEYLDGPDNQPDLDLWRTNLLFKLA